MMKKEKRCRLGKRIANGVFFLGVNAFVASTFFCSSSICFNGGVGVADVTFAKDAGNIGGVNGENRSGAMTQTDTGWRCMVALGIPTVANIYNGVIASVITIATIAKKQNR